jgi:hypothetical protein
MTNYIDRPALRYPTARTPSAPSEATDEWSNEPKSATNSSNAATTASSSTPTPRRSRSSGPWPKSAALRSTLTDDPVGRWAANKVESAYVPVYGSWLNRIEPQFTAGATPPSTAPATTAPREGQDDPPPHRLAEPARHRSPHPQDLRTRGDHKEGTGCLMHTSATTTTTGRTAPSAKPLPYDHSPGTRPARRTTSADEDVELQTL